METTHPATNPVIAVIDIGTNSVHLLIAQTDQYGHMVRLDSDKEVVRLGEALEASGELSQTGISKITDVLARMKDIASAYQPIYRVVATHATRVAKNYQTLIRQVFLRTGLHISLIDGDEEARLVSLGMQWGFPLQDTAFLGADIGGGSTELIVCRKDEIFYVTSFELGAVTLNRKFLTARGYQPDLPLKMKEEIDLKLSPLGVAARKLHFESAIICSGTAKTLAMMHAFDSRRGTPENLNGYIMNAGDIHRLTEELTETLDPEAIRKRWGIDSDRADIILAGALILRRLTSVLGVSQWTVSAWGLREGLVHDTLSRIHALSPTESRNVRWNQIRLLGRQFCIDESYAEQITAMALSLYDQIHSRTQPDRSDGRVQVSDRSMLKAAAWLHECGKFLNFSRYHRHSCYLITNSRLMGFSDRERRMIGLIARYHRKGKAGKKSEDCLDLSREERNKVNYLAAFLRIAVAANRSRQKQIISIQIRQEGNSFIFVVQAAEPGAGHVELVKLAREKTLLEEQLGHPIHLQLAQ